MLILNLKIINIIANMADIINLVNNIKDIDSVIKTSL
jgi:hypothetical protein